MPGIPRLAPVAGMNYNVCNPDAVTLLDHPGSIQVDLFPIHLRNVYIPTDSNVIVETSAIRHTYLSRLTTGS